MAEAAFGGSAFSSVVNLWLEVGDRRINLAQVAPEFVIAAEATECRPGEATVVVSIDGDLFRRPVRLIHGMQSTSLRAAVVEAEDEPPF